MSDVRTDWEPEGMKIDLSKITKLDAIFQFAVAGHTARKGPLAATAYVGHFTGDGHSTWLWGYGSTTNTDMFYLHAIDAMCREMEAHSGFVGKRVTCFTKRNGFVDNVKRFVPIWEKNGGRKSNGIVPDGYDLYKQCYNLLHLGTIEVLELGIRDGGETVEYAHVEAQRIAAIAATLGADASPGLHATGDDLKGV